MAKQYTLLDRMFPDMFGPSFTAHLSLIAGTTAISSSKAEIDTPQQEPWSCDSGSQNPTVTVDRVALNAPGYLVPHYFQPIPPCFTQFATMADTLDAKNVSWRYYAPALFTGFQTPALQFGPSSARSRKCVMDRIGRT